jgi:hypothetical protein
MIMKKIIAAFTSRSLSGFTIGALLAALPSLCSTALADPVNTSWEYLPVGTTVTFLNDLIFPPAGPNTDDHDDTHAVINNGRCLVVMNALEQSQEIEAGTVVTVVSADKWTDGFLDQSQSVCPTFCGTFDYKMQTANGTEVRVGCHEDDTIESINADAGSSIRITPAPPVIVH